jgi:putative transposase
MPDFRRNFQPGGAYFFTVVTDGRAPILCGDVARGISRAVLAEGRRRWPFRIDAIVLLPDHLHTIWTLPEGDACYPMRWGWIKKEFTVRWIRAGGAEQPQTKGRRRDGRRGVLQPKYWEHTLQNEGDFERHFDYIHFNPVCHGLVRCPRDWPFSSFHRWVRWGVYPVDWACSGSGAEDALKFEDLETTAME